MQGGPRMRAPVQKIPPGKKITAPQQQKSTTWCTRNWMPLRLFQITIERKSLDNTKTSFLSYRFTELDAKGMDIHKVALVRGTSTLL